MIFDRYQKLDIITPRVEENFFNLDKKNRKEIVYMNVKSVVVEKTSKKGNSYIAIEVYITDNIKKLVFLTPAELELLKINYGK